MKRSVYILLISAGLLLGSCAQNASKEEAVMAKADSISVVSSELSIEHDFSSDSLSEEQKELFGKRAMQKLEDYFGCLEIMSDTKYDTTLRNQAKAIAEEMFFDKKYLHDVFDLVPKNSGTTKTTIHNVIISSLPRALNDSTYQGGIAFEMHTNNNEGRKEHINFTVRKIQKNFGTEEKLVWETYLEMNK